MNKSFKFNLIFPYTIMENHFFHGLLALILSCNLS